MTKPFVCDGTSLHLNAKADHGQLRVALLAEDETPLEGYGFDDCHPIQQDSVQIPVRWGEDDHRLPNAPVRLQFELNNARLFAYWCV